MGRFKSTPPRIEGARPFGLAKPVLRGKKFSLKPLFPIKRKTKKRGKK